MKLYIPEIGDHMVLTKDWIFTLHSERRNTTLAELNGYYLHGWNTGWVSEADLPKMRDIDYHVEYPSDDEFKNFFGTVDTQKQRAEYYKRLEASPEYKQYNKDLKVHKETAAKLAKKEFEITLNAGTILAVDRIYIRKGASDYSSITFYAKNIGESSSINHYTKKTKKVKAFRFWVKLDECNKIEFEKIDKIK